MIPFIKNIITSEGLLSRTSKEVVDFGEVLSDEVMVLRRTAEYNSNTDNNKMGCIGLAANQIGILKQIIMVLVDNKFIPMVNPKITPNPKAGMLGGAEYCLSRPGQPGIFVKRYKKIEVTYYDPVSQTMLTKKFSKLTAKIIQHEMDHLNGVLI